MTTRGVAAAVLIALVLMSVGCADLRRTFGAEVALYSALQVQFRGPIAVVRSANGVLMLSVEVPQSEAKKVMPGIDRERALRIAKFARAHYTDTIGLRSITVFFTTRTDSGVLHIPHSYPGGTWSIISLDSEPDPAQTESAGQSTGVR
jgi:hypothetical protein